MMIYSTLGLQLQCHVFRFRCIPRSAWILLSDNVFLLLRVVFPTVLSQMLFLLLLPSNPPPFVTLFGEDYWHSITVLQFSTLVLSL